MNKNASTLITVITFIFGVIVYLFFSFHVSQSLPVASENISIQKETLPVVKNQPRLQKPEVPAAVTKVEDQQKIERALHHIKNKSRLPTGQLKIEPEHLQNHEAFEGTRWKILSRVKAVLRTEISETDVIVGEIGRFSLVELTNIESALNQYDRNSPSVVYETRLKRIGLVTGLIKVETERKDLLENSIQNMNAQISNSFDSIQTYFVTSQQTVFDLEKLFFSIKALGFVKTAELDILDREYEKK